MQAVGVVFHPIQDRAALFIVGNIGGQPVQFALGKFLGKFIARLRQGIGIAGHHQQVGAEAEQFARNGRPIPALAPVMRAVCPSSRQRCVVTWVPLFKTQENGRCCAVDAHAWPKR